MLTKSIAIIDDEIDLVNLFREALEMDGFKVCTFTDPINALNQLQQCLEEYAIIISDFSMPSMNGNDLCTKLMNINPKLKFILMSAYQDVEYDKSKFTFLNKPIPIAQILKIVKQTLTE
jgi:DNA-binding NtrC family response regulator